MSQALNLKQMVEVWPVMPVELVEKFISLFSLDEEGVTIFSESHYLEARKEDGQVVLQIGKVHPQNGQLSSAPADILHVLRGRWDNHAKKLYDETVVNVGKNSKSIFDLSVDLKKIIESEKIFIQ